MLSRTVCPDLKSDWREIICFTQSSLKLQPAYLLSNLAKKGKVGAWTKVIQQQLWGPAKASLVRYVHPSLS